MLILYVLKKMSTMFVNLLKATLFLDTFLQKDINYVFVFAAGYKMDGENERIHYMRGQWKVDGGLLSRMMKKWLDH